VPLRRWIRQVLIARRKEPEKRLIESLREINKSQKMKWDYDWGGGRSSKSTNFEG
jgi:hypothetical protein